ncbi:MAG: hypothetical protein NVS9B15_00510 [Acidobacteriaceae bacterium]
MRLFPQVLLVVLLLVEAAAAQSHLGFDKNEYPGDDALPQLKKTFEWTGYWLSNPPGATSNSWLGKRGIIKNAGVGFALLYLAKSSAQLQGTVARGAGVSDAEEAVASARREGFARPAVIFLDIEEGGRLVPRHLEYIRAWVAQVRRSGYQAGIYCSGIAVPDGAGKTVTSAESIQQAKIQPVKFWIANDVCPPSPGCVAVRDLTPLKSGTQDAEIWQYAQTPRRPQFASACARSYAADNRCIAPGTNVFVDMNVSLTKNPSQPSH